MGYGDRNGGGYGGGGTLRRILQKILRNFKILEIILRYFKNHIHFF